MLTALGAVIFLWCPTGHADRLYTWEDDKGVTHISKEPPPQKTKLIDTMDYRPQPANKNKATGKQVSDDGESSQSQRIGVQEKGKASGPTGSTQDVDDDEYYDSGGGRYTRRAIRHERGEARENRKESDHSAEQPNERKSHRRK